MFGEICDYVITDFIFYPREFHIDHPVLLYNNVLHLQDVGLVHASAQLVKRITLDIGNKTFQRIYQNMVLKITTEQYPKEIRTPEILLTTPGKELYRIAECGLRLEYLQSFSKFLQENECELFYAHVVKEQPDGSVTPSVPFVPIGPEPDQPGDVTS